MELGVRGGFAPNATVESAVKFVPVRVKLKVAVPAVTVVGLMLVSVGTGETPVPVRGIEIVAKFELFEICRLAVRAPA